MFKRDPGLRLSLYCEPHFGSEESTLYHFLQLWYHGGNGGNGGIISIIGAIGGNGKW